MTRLSRHAEPPAPPITLTLPPLPRLTWGGSWQGEATLPSWRGFRSLNGFERRPPSKGRVGLTVVHPMAEGLRYVPSPEQVASFVYFVEHEAAVFAAAIRALVPYARRQIARIDEYDDVQLPPVRRAADLQRLIEPSGVYLLVTATSGVAYTGLSFHCAWDDEHGAGLLMHRRRIVDVGHASSAFHEGEAAADAAQRT